MIPFTKRTYGYTTNIKFLQLWKVITLQDYMDKLTKEEGLLILELVIDSMKETKEMQNFNLFQNESDQKYFTSKLKLLIDIYNKDFYSQL